MDTKYSRTIHTEHGYDKNAHTYYPILIVGAGEAGIAMACRLKQRLGFDQFRIFDRQAGIGGTWWINRYPGVACDVPIAFYSYSFAPFFTAKSIYPDGKEIVQYLHRVASKFQIIDKIQLNTEISEMRWIDREQMWEVTITYMAPGTGDMAEKDRQAYIAEHGLESVYLKQEKVRAKVVLSGVGGLVEPKAWPDNIPGKEDFQGEVFHSARWKSDVEIKGKDVVIVGTGCSSVQVAQALLEKRYNAKSVTQLMRTPPWCTEKVAEPFGKKKYAKWAPRIVSALPILGWAFRYTLAVGAEQSWFKLFLDRESSAQARKKTEERLIKRMKKRAPEKYHEMLTPNYSVGCKRRIFDPDPGWYACMNDSRYRLTTQTLKSLRRDGAKLSSNQTYPPSEKKNIDAEDEFVPADVVVLANGFDLREWLHPLNIIGRNGRSIRDVWKERGGPQAYMCTAMDGFPNFFIVFGPNAYTGHSSVVFTIENLVEYIITMIEPIVKGNVGKVEVKKSAQMEWTRKLQLELKSTVFESGNCTSWYKTEGWNSTSYPRSQIEFMIRCFFPKHSDWNTQLTNQGIIRRLLRKMLGYALFAFMLVAAFWARRSGKSPLNFLREKLKEGARDILALLAGTIAQVQRRVQ